MRNYYRTVDVGLPVGHWLRLGKVRGSKPKPSIYPHIVIFTLRAEKLRGALDRTDWRPCGEHAQNPKR